MAAAHVNIDGKGWTPGLQGRALCWATMRKSSMRSAAPRMRGHARSRRNVPSRESYGHGAQEGAPVFVWGMTNDGDDQ